MKIKKAEMAATAAWQSQYPEVLALDVVLAGRSNVGKSSLVNKLINRKNLARTSSQPGKTRTINFYRIDDGWYFVDLPGYGYAKVSKSERDAFQKMVNEYLKSERRRVIWQIVDLRHPPTALDRQMNEFLRSKKLPFMVVATKADKLSNNEVAKNKAVMKRELNLKEEELVIFSANDGRGKDELLKRIEYLLKAKEEQE
ncbi:MAG: YihA family ribosome biogenesis GTP-binding protein [Firmicutes bacterium]|nr:YihA family ribosome biogenesis GTP-binding protein [Bacillota bacterium]